MTDKNRVLAEVISRNKERNSAGGKTSYTYFNFHTIDIKKLVGEIMRKIKCVKQKLEVAK